MSAAWAAVRNAARKGWRGFRIGLRAARILAVSRALPLPLRVLLVLGWLFLRHRGTLRDALGTARREIAAK